MDEKRFEPMDAFEAALRALEAKGETLSRTQELTRERFAEEYDLDRDEVITDYRNIRGE